MSDFDFASPDYYGNDREFVSVTPADAGLVDAAEDAARRFEQHRDAECVISELSEHIWAEVTDARAAAHLKHGDKSIEQLRADDPTWISVLGEELGDVYRALTYDGSDLRDELIDVLAVASAWITAMDNDDAERDRRWGG